MLLKKYLWLFISGSIIIYIVDAVANSFNFMDILPGYLVLDLIPFFIVCIYGFIFEKITKKHGKEYILWSYFAFMLVSYLFDDITIYYTLKNYLKTDLSFLHIGIYAAMLYGVLYGLQNREEKKSEIHYIENRDSKVSNPVIEKNNKINMFFMQKKYLVELVIGITGAMTIINFKVIGLVLGYM